MDIQRQTASVVSSPLRKIELVKDYELQNDSIGLLGCLNPESHNQKEMFYCSPTTYKIRLIDNDMAKLPPALSNPQYPNPYEMIFRDRGSDNNNPNDWVKLDKIYGRQALNVKQGTPWKVTWDFDGTYGIQTATIQGLSFTRETAIDDSDRIIGFTHWKMQSNFYYGAIRVTFSSRPNNVANNMLGWASSTFMIGQGVDEQTYPEAFKVMIQGTKAGLFPFLEDSNAAGRVSIRMRDEISNRYFGVNKSQVGFLENQSLPNIEGGVIISSWLNSPWGAFVASTAVGNSPQHLRAERYVYLLFNAKFYNNIYKNTARVTPNTAWVDIECFVGY